MSRRPEISPLSLLMRRVDAVADGERSSDSVATGFPSVDKILGGGIRRGDLVVLGGDVGSGKSALGLAITLRAAQEGRTTAFLTGEMSVDRVMERALAIEGRAKIDDIRRGGLDEVTRASVGAAAIRLRDNAPVFDRLPSGGVDALRDELKRVKALDFAVVDSVQSLSAGAKAQDEELAATVRQLKALAIDLDVGLLVTSHLPLSIRDRRDMRPQLEDFGGLGAIKQTADVVMSLFREEMYQSGNGVEGATELLINKNRNGATGYVDLYFYKQWMRFEDMLDPDR